MIYLLLLILSATALSATDVSAWPQDSPENHGLVSAQLDSWRTKLANAGTVSLVIVCDDKIVYEWYGEGHGPNRREGTASLAKAIVGGSSLMLALQDHRLTADDRAALYIPEWRDDPQKSRITIRELATHTSGIEDAEQDGLEHTQLRGWKGAFWKRTPDPFTIALNQAPVIFRPGSSFEYSNPGMAALAYAVTASLRGSPQTDIRSLLKARLFDRIGIPDSQWSIGYNTPYHLDGLTLFANWGGGAFTPRATARIGQLMLHQGEWEGKHLVNALLTQTMTSYAGMPIRPRTPTNPSPGSGLCWWLNFDSVWPQIPSDAFAGAGAGQQLLLVVPSLNLIVVRNGTALGAADRFWADAVNLVFSPIVNMARSKPPYPPSKIIREVSFAPESTIVRQAIESDNWPITWADDDDQYTSYGDGWGFDPKTDRKLSLGLSKIAGSPSDFHGINIRSASAERTGDGEKGPKASGMLMVDGVLYMFVRNTANSQLAWSKDHGKTWQWGFRFTTSFASPTFLNFGRNYAGARDEFVYVYSQNGESAYESDDSLVLARVRRGLIRNRTAYEFLELVDSSGRPHWTKDIGARGSVFSFRKHCQRVDVVYHPVLKRYLLALGYNHMGGWGIFEAPEPWGPWSTVFHTDYWGLGGTHGYRLPVKWIGPDPRNMTLLFSGVRLPAITYDAFCVRGMKLELIQKAY